MEEKDNVQYLNKDDALDILDRTIDFVRNCDNKASIFLGIFGVILTIALTTEGLDNLMSIIRAAIAQKGFCNILFLLIMAGFLIITVFGLSQIIKVLGVKVDSSAEEGLDGDSKIFFEYISKNNYLSYKKKLLAATEEEFFNDITSQIYINSCICRDKYKSYKCGLKWTLIGFCGFTVLWIIGAIIF
ncbi:MAG: hypothetical protein ACI4ES_05470 [Roseburia sp.]